MKILNASGNTRSNPHLGWQAAKSYVERSVVRADSSILLKSVDLMIVEVTDLESASPSAKNDLDVKEIVNLWAEAPQQ